MGVEFQHYYDNGLKYKKSFEKESFKFVYDLIKKNKPSTLLDIGCASGDFLFGLDNNIKAVGIDKSEELISIANKKNTNNVSFICMDILNCDDQILNPILENNAELITILGAFHTFHNFHPLLDKLINLNNTKRIIIHSLFNPAPIDVQVFHRDLTVEDSTFGSSYNIFSNQSIINYFKHNNIAKYEFLPFEMKATLKKNEKYPMRNYHVFMNDGQKFSTNGACILYKESMLVIDLK